MERSHFRWFVGILVCFYLSSHMFGCGRRDGGSTPIQESQEAAQQELPVLEQNLIYMNNREGQPSIEPDYSFTDFPNDLQPVPEDAVPSPKLD